MNKYFNSSENSLYQTPSPLFLVTCKDFSPTCQYLTELKGINVSRNPTQYFIIIIALREFLY